MGGWPRYLRLTRREPVLALWLHEAPRDVLDVLREAATRHVLRAFPGYGAIRDEVHVRVSDVPLQDSLRHLTCVHLDGLVRAAGVVTRRTGVFLLRLAYYDCIRCRGVCGPYSIDEGAALSGRGGRDSTRPEVVSVLRVEVRQISSNGDTRGTGLRPSLFSSPAAPALPMEVDWPDEAAPVGATPHRQALIFEAAKDASTTIRPRRPR